jgi:hypothetical protein
MSRKYSAWASNQPSINPDSSMMRLATVIGNEQDQRKYFVFYRNFLLLIIDFIQLKILKELKLFHICILMLMHHHHQR